MEQKEKIGIIGAMDIEISLLAQKMREEGGVTSERVFSLDFFEGTLSGCPVTLVKSGIGKVNAALCAQLLVLKFGARKIINTGIAGGAAKGLRIFDMVASTEAVYHDFDVTAFGYEPSVIPQMETSVFQADKAMLKAAIECFNALEDSRAADEKSAEEQKRKIIAGRVASGDQFISDSEKKAKIKRICDPACIEMEGAAIAHACFLCGVPFLILRCVSDMAEDGEESSYKYNDKTAAQMSAALVEKLVAEI